MRAQVGELCGVEQLSMYARSSVLPYLAVAAPLQVSFRPPPALKPDTSC